MSMGTPPTAFELLPLSIAHPGTLVTERPAEMDPGMAKKEVGIQAKTAAQSR
jgi:hypothetical protein